MNTPRIHIAIKTSRILATTIALLLAPAALQAADRFWISPIGGTFNVVPNWSATDGGAGGASIPGAADVANFTLNNTYSTSFGFVTTNTALDVDNGNVSFDLNGLAYTLTAAIAIEIGTTSGQTGRLTVREGILGVDTTGDSVRLGSNAGSIGFLTISTGGRLGDGTLRPSLLVGNSGTGTLAVTDNGRVDGNSALIGSGVAATGTMSVTGPNAVVDLSGVLTVGISGTGTMTASNGGTVTTASSATLGDVLGSDGTATVTGVGTSLATTGTTTIGNSGDGTLAISGGGLVSSTGSVSLGSVSSGFGTATVSGTGSRWNLASTQTIGGSGLGVMTISSGGEVASSSSATLGSGAGSEGRVTVTGAGSQWTMSSNLTVGSNGTGDLTVSAGGEVSAATVILGNFGSGTATVTGAGSKLTSTTNLAVGNFGPGTLNVASGGEVHVGAALNVLDAVGGAFGTLDLDGGSIFVAGGFTNNSVFNFSNGLLRVAGSFQPSVAANPLVINGGDSGDLPVLELIGGAGANPNITSVTVGSNQRGELRLRQGRIFNIGGNAVAIGAFVGGEGTVSVESGAQFLASSSFSVGGSSTTAGGTGTLNISGGTVDTATLRIFNGGTVNLSSGTLAVDSTPTLDGKFNWTGGTLRFDAAFLLTSANVPKLLGLDATLNAGQVLASTAALTLQTPMVVDGGALNASLLVNQSRLEVRSGSIGAVQNDGLLLGDGTFSGTVTNNAAGRIRVDTGKTLFFSGPFGSNVGELNLQGGTLDFTSAVTNASTGFIAGRGALYTGGLTNSGQMAFSGGAADIHGDVTNSPGGRIVTSGGATTTFFDDVIHNGLEIRTSAGGASVFFGAVSGAGPFTGTGTVYFEGDLRPGNSPASVSYGGDLVFGGASSLTLEIGGLVSGTEHDHLDIAGTLFANGALEVLLYDGFAPHFGDAFDLFDAGNVAGSFDTIELPDLSGGLEWDATQLQTIGQLRVVPEPSAGMLALLGTALLGRRRRRAQEGTNAAPRPISEP